MSDTRLLYDRKSAAHQLSLSVRSIDALLAKGALQFRRVGSKVLIPHGELVRFAKADHFEAIQSNSARKRQTVSVN